MPADAPHPSKDSQQPASDQPSTHTVVLLHTLPDGSSHFDWFIEIPNRSEERRLRSFRTDSDPSLWHSGQLFHGEQLPDHRAHYLNHEGPIDGDRGSVVQVARGSCKLYHAASEMELAVVVDWDSADKLDVNFLRYNGKNMHGQHWEFRTN